MVNAGNTTPGGTNVDPLFATQSGQESSPAGVGELNKPDSPTPLDTEIAEPEEDEEDEAFIEVQLLVSSRHLRLVSPVFKAMLKYWNFQEAGEFCADDPFKIPLPDDDPDQFITLMDIIHLRNSRLPRPVSLHYLTDIAILIDKYQMVEATRIHTNDWIEALKPQLPERYHVETGAVLEKWLCISWFINRKIEFEEVNRRIGKGLITTTKDNSSQKSCREVSLVPDVVHKALYDTRLKHMAVCYSNIKEMITKLLRENPRCPATMEDDQHRKKCDTMVLGSIFRDASTYKLYPAPRRPYNDITFNEVIKGMLSMKVSCLCDSLHVSVDWERESVPKIVNHGWETLIHGNAVQLDKIYPGLNLDNFKPVKKTSI